MPLPSLPDECFSNIFSFLDNESLYKCLFVNRYYCKLSIPIIWRDPFTIPDNNGTSLISTLFSCLDEDEISSLIPCVINLVNFNNQPLFEYGNFIRKIDHSHCVDHIRIWLIKKIPLMISHEDCIVRKLTDAIYHMIMRKGSNLQEFDLNLLGHGWLPKFSTFTSYKPGIVNLSSLMIYNKRHNIIEFLRMVSEFCNCIINFEVQFNIFNNSVFTKILNIIKLQPLKRVLLYDGDYALEIKKTLYTLKEFRSETLKELLFRNIDFQRADLSFISELKLLERLEFKNCAEFTFKEKLHLKELKLCYGYSGSGRGSNKDLKLHAVSVINSFCSEILHKLTLNIVTLETVKVVKQTCPNISFLCIKFSSMQFFNITIPLICEISSLRTLKIKLSHYSEELLLIKLLCNHLMHVECLFLDFPIELQNFEYFTSNCKVKLKRLYILVNSYRYIFRHLKKSYLVHVNNFQKTHNSLKIFGIKGCYGRKFYWMDEEIEIINVLKNQGTDVVSPFSEILQTS